ncbi:MAG: helix-turn-helix domain-containing protein [Lachnospiraceae bacterium]|nr:helix-turn-helix domain-containing protein [Lachnospiraceae bacterium]
MGIDYIKLGKNIKYCRKQKNITQEQLAEALDLSTGFVSQIERGVGRMSLDTLINICDFLECSAGDIISNSQLAYTVPKINDFNPQINDDFYLLYKKLPIKEQQLFYHMLKAYIENI